MNLLNFLKANANTRKIFGKRELKIIEKQMQGINLTQSEKNRLSRDIRKKLEFVRDAASLSGEFKLKKGAEIKEIIEDAKNEIIHDKIAPKIKEIILFGSATENQMTSRSDIDLAVKFSDININDATLFRARTAGRISQKIDIQVYNILPEKIKKEIDEKGRVIYKHEQAE